MTRAIDRGIRRSKGVGFREKEKAQNQHADHSIRKAPVRRTADPPPGLLSRSSMTRDAWRHPNEKPSVSSKQPRNPTQTPRKGRFGEVIARSTRSIEDPVRIRMGKRMLKNGEERSRGRSNDTDSSFDMGKASSLRDITDRDSRNLSIGGKGRYSRNTRNSTNRPQWDRRGKSNSHDSEFETRFATSTTKYPSLATSTKSYEPKLQVSDTGRAFSGENSNKEGGRERNLNNKDRTTQVTREIDGQSTSSHFKKSIDKRMPISIPYTTPASEFLYGTSVVEAALKSKSVPRRKNYKLYIYTGEKRENIARDADLERLARRSGIEVARVGPDWLPLLDKMSGSRPHNGYILEASPLPRLPVTSLGGLSGQDERPGFNVALDFQSREDAAINGTANFIRTKNSSGRKPLVLFLDSILDPGNLGGIIRTASFLGVTAVAISKNCTAFSPVVLKASAGASENITLFTVNKPAGFIADSKLAGWKIFAAVAPSGSTTSAFISTDDLADPLSDHPCILMLGGEGEGLRVNLRSKADVQLSIRGSGQNHNSVDSLNVSVATGILCNTFLKTRSTRKSASPVKQIPEVGNKPVRDLF